MCDWIDRACKGRNGVHCYSTTQLGEMLFGYVHNRGLTTVYLFLEYSTQL